MHFPAVWFGTLRDHYLFLFGAAGSIALAAGFIGAWLGSFIGGRSAAKRALTDGTRNFVDQRQIDEISQALDVLTVEVERMTEGHRFIAKLLSDRSRDLVPPAREKKSEHITPH
ncbi:MAG TPA: hypothetical protein VF105_10920 [Gemmatimonadaceae bacterium]